MIFPTFRTTSSLLNFRTISRLKSKNISIDTLYFADLESTADSVTYVYKYSIKDEISEIAKLKTFKLIFPDLVATSNHFISSTREYPVNYMAYEDTDNYITTIQVEIQNGQKFVEVPSDVTLSFGGMSYSLHTILPVQNYFSSRESSIARDHV